MKFNKGEKMSNEKVKFKGLVKWASVPPNEPRKPYEIDEKEPDNTSYSIEVECSVAQFNELMKKGLPKLSTLREDEETGKTYIRVKASKVKGKYTFPDPKVVDIAGNKFEKKIGNGSECVVIAELRPIKGRKGVALGLKAVQVLKHVAYEDDSDIDDMLEIHPHAEMTTHDVDDDNEW